MEPTATIAIIFADGTVGRMQFYADPTDANIQAAIDKGRWSSQPASWRRASLSEFVRTPSGLELKD